MNSIHLHLMLVHVPVVLVPIATLVFAFGQLRGQKAVRGVGVSLFLLSALFVVPVFLLGEEAEELTEHVAGVRESAIEAHEESAELALWLTLSLGLVSLISAMAELRAFSQPRVLGTTLMLLGLASSGALAYSAQAGGKIRHPEAFDAVETEQGSEHDEADEREDD